MASYVFNNTRTVSTGTEMFLLGASDQIVLGSQAFWVATNSTCVGISLQSGDNRVTIAGQIYTVPNAVFGLGGSDRVQVTGGGIVSSASGSAIYLEGANNHVQNDGQISGNQGVRFVDSGNSVVNSGTMVGALGAGLIFGVGLGADKVTNTGTIGGYADTGIYSMGTGTLTVINAGLISVADGEAISADNVLSATIMNSGIIDGFVSMDLGNGSDRVTNTGTIVGTAILNAGNDVFDTSEGTMIGVVSGGDGDDAIVGSALRDRLDGDSGDDELTGNAGNDILAGGSGADELDGGEGRDTADYRASGSAVTADLETPALNTGAAVGDSYISIENLIGSIDEDRLFGNADRNVLRGEGDNDLLDGRGGADVLRGGEGSDFYVVDNRGDRVIEFFGEGYDRVSAGIDYTLPDFVEVLTLIGPAAINGYGNALDNRITGNAAANTINGGAGYDILVGGGGADRFRFTSELVPDNADIVDDFEVGIDKLVLSRSIFTELNGGSALIANRFVVGSAAQDANDRIIYDPTTGGLFYDPDGTGSTRQILFVGIDTGVMLTANDIQLVG